MLLGFGRNCANLRLKMASVSFDACPETLQEVISVTVVTDILQKFKTSNLLAISDRCVKANQLANLI